jgi:hypothetical protein
LPSQLLRLRSALWASNSDTTPRGCPPHVQFALLGGSVQRPSVTQCSGAITSTAWPSFSPDNSP